MSGSTFGVNNTKYFSHDNLTLVVGTMEVNTSPAHSITIKPTILDDAHVVVDRSQLSSFRALASAAPVPASVAIPTADAAAGNLKDGFGAPKVYLYDQTASIVSRYEASRKSNTTGTLNISVDPVTLVCNIVIPKVTSGNIYLPLTSYPALSQVSTLESQVDLVKQDFDEFARRNDLSTVCLVISKSLEKVLLKIDPEFATKGKTIFKSYEAVDIDPITYLTERMFGKVISGHRPSFQGFMNFGPNFDVVHSQVRYESDTGSSVAFTNRRGGRIQVNVAGQNAQGTYMIVLRRLTKDPEALPSFTEETTGSTCTFTTAMEVDPSTFPDLSPIYLRNYLETIAFQEKFQATEESKRVAMFQASPAVIVRYLFTQPETTGINPKELNGLCSMVYNDFSGVMSHIRRNIMATTTVAPPPGPLRRQYGGAYDGYALAPASSACPPSPPYVGRVPSGGGYLETACSLMPEA